MSTQSVYAGVDQLSSHDCLARASKPAWPETTSFILVRIAFVSKPILPDPHLFIRWLVTSCVSDSTCLSSNRYKQLPLDAITLVCTVDFGVIKNGLASAQPNRFDRSYMPLSQRDNGLLLDIPFRVTARRVGFANVPPPLATIKDMLRRSQYGVSIIRN